MTPKSLLRLKRCQSTLADFAEGSSFHRVLFDKFPSEADRQVERVVVCTGKVYYDLKAEAEKRGVDDRLAFLRLEELAPFPEAVLAEQLARYPKAVSVVWCQEEPRNMGAWFFVQPRLANMLEKHGFSDPRPVYAGRPPAASPASGFTAQHHREQERLIDEALTLAR